jgi:alpha-L-fucosidase
VINSVKNTEDKVQNVQMLGSKSKLKWSQNENGLTVEMPTKKPCDYAFVLKLTMK